MSEQATTTHEVCPRCNGTRNDPADKYVTDMACPVCGGNAIVPVKPEPKDND